ncbi:hypothetical protein ACH4TX_42135 [Streptomyces sp. NPDC021098]|uniref:hypothetical protein n=1 Tax=unclassified Streptomyces TaxID=2593676 RepID=UPI0037AE68F2
MANDKPTDSIVIDVCKDGWTGGLQLGISQLDENGTGTGYRLAGPKYNGSQKRLLKHTLDERDAEEIRGYLRAVFPDSNDARIIERLREVASNADATVQDFRDALYDRGNRTRP